jgi:hypothetical protein
LRAKIDPHAVLGEGDLAGSCRRRRACRHETL